MTEPVTEPVVEPAPAPASPLAEAQATLAAWRAGDAARADPVRLAWMDALLRRAAAQPAAVQQRVHQRLAPLLAAYAQRLQQPAVLPPSPPATALSPLLQHLAAHAGEPGPAGQPSDLKTLQHFRAHWQRLRLERRLVQARATVPGQAGPLNSHSLVLQALTQLQALSPAYLQHLLAQVDTLAWLEQAQAAVAAAAAPRPAARSTARGSARAPGKGTAQRASRAATKSAANATAKVIGKAPGRAR